MADYTSPKEINELDYVAASITVNSKMPLQDAIGNRLGHINLSDLQDLIGVSNLDEIADGTTYAKTTIAEVALISTNASDISSLQTNTYSVTELDSGQLDNRYYTETETDTLLSTKQDNLVSGTNIKTINDVSVLGSGDLDLTPTWISISTSQTLSSDSRYSVDFTLGPLTLTLPLTPVENDFVKIYRSAGDSTDSVIARNGETIMGLAEDLVIDYNITSIHLVYNGTDWRII